MADYDKELGKLWEGTKSDGEKMLSGTLEIPVTCSQCHHSGVKTIKVVGWVNRKREGKKDADWRIMPSKPKPGSTSPPED